MERLENAIDWKKARFVVIGARPAMGKTNFALNFVCHKIQEENASILYFHLEEGNENIIERLLAIHSRLSYTELQQGNLNDTKWKKLQQTIKEMKEWKLYLDKNYRFEKVIEQIRKTKREKGLQYVVIDTWQYLSSNNSRCLSRMDELNEMAHKLKELATELQICILCISQLSRSPEKRDNHRPMLEDFGYSEKSITIADAVLLIYREDYYQKKHKNKEELEVIIAKNILGKCQTIPYWINWNCLQIKEERKK